MFAKTPRSLPLTASKSASHSSENNIHIQFDEFASSRCHSSPRKVHSVQGKAGYYHWQEVYPKVA